MGYYPAAIIITNTDTHTGRFGKVHCLAAAEDVVVVNHGSAGTAGSYLVGVSEIAAGSFKVTVTNASAGNLTEAIVFNFVALKGASS